MVLKCIQTKHKARPVPAMRATCDKNNHNLTSLIFPFFLQDSLKACLRGYLPSSSSKHLLLLDHLMYKKNQ